MIRTCFSTLTSLAIAVSFLLSAAVCRAEYKYIDISNPFMRKIPIAVPVFKKITQDENAVKTARQTSELLADFLEFTGLFKISDPGAFLENPETMGVLRSEIRFGNWTAIGSELLVTGIVSVNADLMDIELRLFDTFKQKLLVGKRYKGNIKDYRKVVKRFSGEIVYLMTGDRGIFDSRIAFISTGTGSKEIYTCGFDGHNPRQLTHHKSISLFPAWSSDGSWIAYTSYKRGQPEIFIRNMKNKLGHRVKKKGLQITPAWVPGRFELAATLSFSGDQEIYLLTGTGKIIKRLTKSMGIDVAPTWSPDGKKMAFVSKRSGSPQIYILDVPTGRVQRLTFEGRYNTQPSWSPKGDKIAYSGMNNGRIDIYVIDTEGNEPIQLTHDVRENEAPSWSPDGSLIAYSSTREGRSRIYVMTAFGTDQRRLLSISGEQTIPRWSSNNVSK